MIELYAKYDIYPAHWGGENPTMGLDAIKRRLRLDTGGSNLKIFNSCKNLIAALSSLTPDPNNPQDMDQTMETAPVDCLRFFLQIIRDTSAPPPMSAIERRLRALKEEREVRWDYLWQN